MSPREIQRRRAKTECRINQCFLNILRYNFLPQVNPHAKYVIMNPETHHQLTDDLELHFLEIPKYQEKEIKSMSRVERWLAYFANQLDKAGKEELAMSSPAIKKRDARKGAPKDSMHMRP